MIRYYSLTLHQSTDRCWKIVLEQPTNYYPCLKMKLPFVTLPKDILIGFHLLLFNIVIVNLERIIKNNLFEQFFFRFCLGQASFQKAEPRLDPRRSDRSIPGKIILSRWRPHISGNLLMIFSLPSISINYLDLS